MRNEEENNEDEDGDVFNYFAKAAPPQQKTQFSQPKQASLGGPVSNEQNFSAQMAAPQFEAQMKPASATTASMLFGDEPAQNMVQQNQQPDSNGY